MSSVIIMLTSLLISLTVFWAERWVILMWIKLMDLFILTPPKEKDFKKVIFEWGNVNLSQI